MTSSTSEDDLRRLPVSVDIVTAGRFLGIGRDAAYDLARRDEFPCPVYRLGRKYVVPTAGLRRLLLIDADPAA